MKKKQAKFPKVKKEIKDFLLSEEGKISKKNVAKVGTSLALLALMFPHESNAQAHSNAFFSTPPGGHNSHSSHGSHASHASHGSHGSHNSGW